MSLARLLQNKVYFQVNSEYGCGNVHPTTAFDNHGSKYHRHKV